MSVEWKEPTKEELALLRATDIKTVDKEKLKDIRDVEIRMELPGEERMADFIRQIENPYCYRYGEYAIKVSFTDTEAGLEDRILSYIRTKM